MARKCGRRVGFFKRLCRGTKRYALAIISRSAAWGATEPGRLSPVRRSYSCAPCPRLCACADSELLSSSQEIQKSLVAARWRRFVLRISIYRNLASFGQISPALQEVNERVRLAFGNLAYCDERVILGPKVGGKHSFCPSRKGARR